MKRIAILLALLIPSAGVLLAAAWRWFTQPLGPPLQIVTRAAGEAKGLPPEYEQYWQYLRQFGTVALVEGGLVVLFLGVIALLLFVIWKEIRGCHIIRRSGIRSSGGSR